MKPIHRTYCLFIALAILWMMPNPSYAVTDTIHGIINICTPVLGIDSCNATLVVKKSYGFKANDRVILIQMQGATISVADDSTYGNLVSLGSAGNYELTTVESVHGNSIQLKYRLERSYDVKGSVQLVRVPHYTGNVVVDSVLTAPKWDGKCGGVLALICDSLLKLDWDISVTGCGFRGGFFASPGDSSNQQGFDYAITSGRSGMKGESIVSNSINTRAGRGKRANGGGGGNSFLSGGGGGGNAGTGGNGGYQYDSVTGGASSVGGRGGVQLTDSTISDRIFLGGGGGSGHQNNHYEAGVIGGRGGGIVFVRSFHISAGIGSGIYAAGDSANRVIGTPAGAGGGGAGGSIILDIDTVVAFGDAGAEISVQGGNGGKIGTNTQSPNLCRGPGGGGSGGRILLTEDDWLIASFNLVTTGGVHGSVFYGLFPCDGISSSYGAQTGVSGFSIRGMSVVESTIPR
jgi:hypothetical protein